MSVVFLALVAACTGGGEGHTGGPGVADGGATDSGMDGGSTDGGAGDGGAEDGGSIDSGTSDGGEDPNDVDGDGYRAGEDCDDSDPEVNPGAEEMPGDGVDQDCDGSDAGPALELAEVETWWQGAEYSMTGFAVADGGDVDGDGVRDFVVGAPWEGFLGGDCTSTVYVASADTFGTFPSAASAEIVDLEECSLAGHSVAGNGDLNGDGFDDVVVGVPNSLESDPEGGRALVFFGPLHAKVSAHDADIDLVSTWGEAQFGYGLLTTPFHDSPDAALMVGAPAGVLHGTRPGEVYIWVSPDPGDRTELSADVTIVGSQLSGEGTMSPATGDLTGDGFDEVVVSEASESSLAPYAGVVYVVGGDELQATEFMVDHMELYSSQKGSLAGRSLAVVPDTDGDGYADLLIGGTLDEQVATRGGKAWLVHGPITASADLDERADATVSPEQGYDWLGHQVSDAGDLDGDGRSDLAISAPRDFYFGGDLPGKVYLFSGTIEGSVTGADADLVLAGDEVGDWAGGGMEAGFDANGDGDPDIIVGAANATNDAGEEYAGRVYLVTDLVERFGK